MGSEYNIGKRGKGMSFAEVKKVNGSPALVIDGRAYPPMAMTTRFHKPEYIKRLGESGLKVFF